MQTTNSTTVSNKIENPTEAVEIMIKAHSKLRRQCKEYLDQCNNTLKGLRKNAARDKRENAERNASFAAQKLKQVEEQIHELDSLHCVVDEYFDIERQIDALCEKRRELCPNSLWQSSLRTTMRDGPCSAY